MKKIDSIDSDGKVLFVAEKGTTVGTKEDCLSYGFNYRNSVCYAYNTTVKPSSDKNKPKGNILASSGNYALGIGNKITSGINNVALGFKNLIHQNADNAIAIGKNAYAENFGEFTYSSSKIPNRAKFSILQFDGITTNATPTEIYLGGHSGARLYINEDYESAFAIDYTATALNANSNQIWTNYGHATYKYTNSTLTEVGHSKSTTIRDSNLDYDIEFAPHNNGNDYIEVKVEGESSHTVYWTVVLQITEVRYG
tara:strand:+ start:6440 stop:7201 length:762 start_codon:yes stop_codon:yes gene_type:complete